MGGTGLATLFGFEGFGFTARTTRVAFAAPAPFARFVPVAARATFFAAAFANFFFGAFAAARLTLFPAGFADCFLLRTTDFAGFRVEGADFGFFEGFFAPDRFTRGGRVGLERTFFREPPARIADFAFPAAILGFCFPPDPGEELLRLAFAIELASLEVVVPQWGTPDSRMAQYTRIRAADTNIFGQESG